MRLGVFGAFAVRMHIGSRCAPTADPPCAADPPPPAPCPPASLPRCRLVINGGEFEAVGTGHPGPRGEKKARQHAALQVLQRAGYSVSFDPPPGPAPGAGGPGGPGGGGGHGPGGGRQRYERGRTLDSRAAAAQQQQNATSRNAYLASLHDELG